MHAKCPLVGPCVKRVETVLRWLWVTSSYSGLVQATIVWPHSCNNQAKVFILRITTSFHRLFCILNCENLNFGIFVEDLARDKLTACSVFRACAKDHAVKIAEVAFFAIIFL